MTCQSSNVNSSMGSYFVLWYSQEDYMDKTEGNKCYGYSSSFKEYYVKFHDPISR